MANFSLAEALRYVNSGFILVIYAYLLNSEATAKLIAQIGAIGVVGASLAFGSVVYVVYRGLIYNQLVHRVHDRINSGKPTYRTYLRDEFLKNSPNESDAVALYVAVRNKYLVEMQKGHETAIANVHNGYISGLLALPFIVACLIECKLFLAVQFFTIMSVILVGSFSFERRLQSEELQKLMLLDREKIDNVRSSIFGELPRVSGTGS